MTPPIPQPEKESLDVMLERIEPRLKSILARYRIPFQDAEDLVQEALLQLVRKVTVLRNPEAFLRTTLRYRCLMYWRKRGRQRLEAVEEQRLEDLAEPLAPEQELAGLRRDVRRLLAELPPRPRQLIRLRYAFGFTAREVASGLGLPPDSVRQRSTYARTLFARRLSSRNLP